LIIEGADFGAIINKPITTGGNVSFSRDYEFDYKQLNIWLSDNKLDLGVVNNASAIGRTYQGSSQITLRMGNSLCKVIPADGTIKGKGSDNCTIKINAKNLGIGHHKSYIHIVSNDSVSQNIIIPVFINVIDNITNINDLDKGERNYDTYCYNHPNPFKTNTTIYYSVPRHGHVLLKVYTIDGKFISTLIDDIHTIGEYKVELNGDGLKAGIYYYQMILDNNKVCTMKIIKE
jgi:hypothetical protein